MAVSLLLLALVAAAAAQNSASREDCVIGRQICQGPFVCVRESEAKSLEEMAKLVRCPIREEDPFKRPADETCQEVEGECEFVKPPECVVWRQHCRREYICGTPEEYKKFKEGPLPGCAPPVFDGFDAYVPPKEGTCVAEDGVCGFSEKPGMLPEPKCDQEQCCDKEHVYNSICRRSELCDDVKCEVDCSLVDCAGERCEEGYKSQRKKGGDCCDFECVCDRSLCEEPKCEEGRPVPVLGEMDGCCPRWECKAPTPEQKCPQVDGPGICVELCGPNSPCEEGKICCSNGCGHVCMEPVEEDECATVKCMQPKECPKDHVLKTIKHKDQCCPTHACVFRPEPSCIEWFDGCNECFRDGADISCTEKECTERGEAKCTKHEDDVCPKLRGEPGICVEACAFDRPCRDGKVCCSNGCGHVCMEPIDDGDECEGVTCDKPPTCERGFFPRRIEVEGECCPQFKCVFHPPADCVRWTDGCNECELGSDGKVKCTDRECVRQGEAKCLARHDRCPEVSDDMAGICVEQCSVQEPCDDGKICCSNGCGHVCMEPVEECPPPPRCPLHHQLEVSNTSACPEYKCVISPPDGCTVFFDGCNECVVMANGAWGCTKKFCPDDQLEKPECRKWKDEEPGSTTQPSTRDDDDDDKPKKCGGFAGIECEEGYQCVDDPRDECDPKRGGADCPGICAQCRPPPECPRHFKLVTRDREVCPTYHCEMDPPEDCVVFFDGCNTCKLMGKEGWACTEMFCLEKKEPKCLENEEPGSTTQPSTRDDDDDDKPKKCGGFAGIECEEGYQCVDDPRDECDPKRGGADCPGICAQCRPPPECPRHFKLVTRDREVCPTYHCEMDPPEDCVMFFDGCNICSRSSANDMWACTRMMCSEDMLKEPECRKYAEDETDATTNEPVTTSKSDGCMSDRECSEGEYCHLCATQPGSDEMTGSCRPHVGQGKACGGGFTQFYCKPSTCEQGLECVPFPQYSFAPQLADAPNLCCPKLDCKCGDNEYHVIEDGCPTCKCAPKPCQETGIEKTGMMSVFCSSNSECDSNVCHKLDNYGVCCRESDEDLCARIRCGRPNCENGFELQATGQKTGPGNCCDEFICVRSQTTPPPVVTREEMFMKCDNGVDENGNECECGISQCEACERDQNNELRCTRCHEDRILNLERNACPRYGECKNNKIVDGVDDCDCGDLANCHICRYSKAFDPPSCIMCKSFTYLHNGECLDKCPDTHYGLESKFGGGCIKADVTCRRGRVRDRNSPHFKETCSCGDDCFDCDLDPSGNHMCKRCDNHKHLYKGKCIDRCPEGTGLTHVGDRKRGRECLPTHSCVGKKHTLTRERCTCPLSVGGRSCIACHYGEDNEPGSVTCTRCYKSALHNGVCVDKCPNGFRPNKNKGFRDVVCIPEDN